MAQEFKVSVDLSQLLALGPIIRAQVFENLSTAVEDVAQAGVERWQRAVLAAKLWDTERRDYAATIRYTMKGPYEAEIVSDYKYVEDIESGRPARDLKAMLNTSRKVRISKKGVRYLIIPFRHNTPGNTALAPAMPPEVYAKAKRLAPSSIIGHDWRVSGGSWGAASYQGGATAVSRKYLWGGKLGKRVGPVQGKNQRDIYAGMYRFKESTGGSQYLTFRTMSDKSTGWIIPAKPGLFIAQAVADSLQRTAEDAFADAVNRDMETAA